MTHLPSTDKQMELPMSTDDTPRPENVTLADEIAGEVWAWFNRHDAPWSPSDATVNDLAFRIKGNVLAAREQVLRDAIEADVLRRMADVANAETLHRVVWGAESIDFGGVSSRDAWTIVAALQDHFSAEADRIEEVAR